MTLNPKLSLAAQIALSELLGAVDRQRTACIEPSRQGEFYAPAIVVSMAALLNARRAGAAHAVSA